MKELLEKLKEFIKTPLGKVALVGVILMVLLFLALVAILLYALISGTMNVSPESSNAPVRVEKSESTTTAKGSTTETDTAGELDSSGSMAFEVYEYKDPFEPLIRAETTAATTSETTATSNTGTNSVTEAGQTTTSSEEAPTGPQVLEVQDIYTENGVKYSSTKYASTVYKVKEGDQVDESPYQVLTIGTDNVVFLYGDRRVEVKIGESILK